MLVSLLVHLVQIEALFSLCFRQSATFPEALGNVDSTSAEKVRGLPDVVGNTGFPKSNFF